MSDPVPLASTGVGIRFLGTVKDQVPSLFLYLISPCMADLANCPDALSV